MAHPKHQAVRIRYAFCCGYCGISEISAGGELTIDHFQPTSRGGDDNNDNLVYACYRCNQYKGFLLPEAANRRPEHRLLHPLRDNLNDHLQLDEATGRLTGLTPAGTFHLTILRLNRAELIANRKGRWQQAQILARLDQALADNAEKAERLVRAEASIRAFEEWQRRIEEQGRNGE